MRTPAGVWSAVVAAPHKARHNKRRARYRLIVGRNARSVHRTWAPHLGTRAPHCTPCTQPPDAPSAPVFAPRAWLTRPSHRQIIPRRSGFVVETMTFRPTPCVGAEDPHLGGDHASQVGFADDRRALRLTLAFIGPDDDR